MIINKEKAVPFFAMVVLIIGISATIYVHAQQSTITQNQDNLIINDTIFQKTAIFEMLPLKTIETDEGEKTGIPLHHMIELLGLSCPSCHTYTFIASDGYQKTVPWDHMQQGVFTEKNSVYFPGLAHAFWVRDIVEIEVN